MVVVCKNMDRPHLILSKGEDFKLHSFKTLSKGEGLGFGLVKTLSFGEGTVRLNS